MKNFLGSYPVNDATWFHILPQMISDDAMVYFLIDRGSFWYLGERFRVLGKG